MNETEASCSVKFIVGVLARTIDETGVNYLRWFPWCRAIRMYRVIKVLGVLPELRTRVNLTLPEQVFFT